MAGDRNSRQKCIHLWLLSWESTGRVGNSEISVILAWYMDVVMYRRVLWMEVNQMLYCTCFECRITICTLSLCSASLKNTFLSFILKVRRFFGGGQYFIGGQYGVSEGSADRGSVLCRNPKLKVTFYLIWCGWSIYHSFNWVHIFMMLAKISVHGRHYSCFWSLVKP